MTTEYSGRTSAYSHKFDDWKEKPSNGVAAISKVTLIEAQWSDMPVEVEEDVKRIWQSWEFGNDHYYFSITLEELETEYPEYDKLIVWLNEKGVEKQENLLIHWWW